ncbi:hypothetical protein [Labilithrix luteola]|nr:hypothetical protein [Labilithrix luteola]
MNRRSLGREVMALFVLVPVVTTAYLVGCSTGEADPDPVVKDAGPALSADAEADADDAADAAEAGPCTDCEFYPAECGEGLFCTVSAPLKTGARLRSIAGTSASSVWAVGTKGTVLHFDGASWQEAALGVLDTFSSVIALSPEEAWTASTFRSVYVHMPAGDGGAEGWQPLSTTEVGGGWPFYQGVVAGAYPTGGPAWFAVQDSRRSVALTRAQRTEDGIETTLIASVPVLSSVLAIHAVSKDEVWAVGGVGRAIRVSDGSGDAPVLQSFNTQTLATLHGVWASGSDDVWAVGSEGTVRRFRGSGVLFDSAPDVPTDVTLRAITGTAPDDVWAVGDGAVVLHFDGVKWTRIAIAGLGARRPDLHAVFCAERGRVWVAGDGVLLSLGKTI